MIHLILGERGPRTARLVNALAGPQPSSDLDSARIDVAETALEDIIGAATTQSFMGGGRKLVLQNWPVPGEKSKAPWKWLEDFVGSSPKDLLMVVTVYLDGLSSQERKQAETRARKLESRGAKVQVLSPLSRTRGDAARQWVVEVAGEEGLEIDAETASYLLSRASTDGAALEQEVRKIAALRGFSGRITMADVREADPHPAEQAIWDYLDAVVERRTGQALDVLGAALDQGEQPEFATALLAVMLRRLIICRGLGADRAPASRLASELGVAEWQARKLSIQAGKFGDSDLQKMLSALVDLDYRYKSGRLAYGGLTRGLEALTVRLCYRAFSPGR